MICFEHYQKRLNGLVVDEAHTVLKWYVKIIESKCIDHIIGVLHLEKSY